MNDKLKSIRSAQKDALHQSEHEADEFLQEASEGWSKVGTKNLDSLMDKLDARLDERTAVSSTPVSKGKLRTLLNPWVMGLAASVITVVLGVWFLNRTPPVQGPPQYTAEILFETYYKPLSGPDPVFRGDRDTRKAKEQAATIAYDAQDYDRAIEHYQELLKEKPGDQKYTLFLGLALMSYEKYDEAIVLYNSYTPSGLSYDEDVNWYLALAHLKKGQLNSAKAILEQLAKSKDSYYHEQASKILSQIEILQTSK